MSMDELIPELLTLLRQLLAGQEGLLQLALARREAMRTFDMARLEILSGKEKTQTRSLGDLDAKRRQLVSRFRAHLPRGAEATVSGIASLLHEPERSQLLSLAAQVRDTALQLERNTRINATISETVIRSMARVLKVVTGLAQHAGIYMRNGRKAALHGIHLLEITA